ncbi:hypothetical protein [Polaromonas aquatica]|uniref:hypothetical protein n=1 Tax=Polaromonas aquatica TaxID=332657 RepID=UPI003D64C7D9
MLKKLLVFAITSGLAAKLYKSHVSKQKTDKPAAAAGKQDPVSRNPPVSKPS